MTVCALGENGDAPPHHLLSHGPHCRAGAAVFTWQRWVCALSAPIIPFHQAAPQSPQCQSHPSHLIPILPPSPQCPNSYPTASSPSSPPLTSSPHYLSPTLSLHSASISSQWSITTSVPILSVSSALHCPHHLIYPISPMLSSLSQPHLTPSPQPHTAPVPTPSPPFIPAPLNPTLPSLPQLHLVTSVSPLSLSPHQPLYLSSITSSPQSRHFVALFHPHYPQSP